VNAMPDFVRLHGPARYALSIAAVFLGPLAFAAPALAAPGWLVPTNLSATGQNATQAQVAMSPTGDAIAVWSRSNGANTIVQAAGKPTGSETWSTPVNLSVAGQNATLPQVAIDPNGDAVAVWLLSNGTTTTVQTASRPTGGSWSSPTDLSESGQNAAQAQVAIDRAGDVIAIWERSNGTNTIIQAASRPAGGAWSVPENLSAAGQSATGPQVAVNGGGDTIAVWTRSNGTNLIVQVTDRLAAGSWSTPIDLSETGQNAAIPRIALNANGDSAVAWRRSNGANEIIQAVTRPAGGSWSSPTNLSETGASANQPRIAVDAAGDALAIWSRPNGGVFTQAASRPRGGSWSTPQNISEAGATFPQLAIDPEGDAVSVWQRTNGTNTIAQAVGFATGPHLFSLSIPASGTVGEALPFSATWWDAWSPVNSIEWGLGDGSGAEGGSFSHAYASVGTYPVSVTATDLRGESAAAGGEVTINPASAPPQTGQTGSGQTGSGSAQAGGGSGQAGGSPVGATGPGGSHKKHHKAPPQKKTKPAALTISLRPSTGFARPTSVLTYRITIANPSGSAAHAVKVCTQLPYGQSALRAQPSADGGASPCWSVGTLAAGARRTLRLSVQVDALVAAGTELARAVASAANVAGTHADTATVRIRALPATACGSSLAGSAIGRLAMRC
jgi:uncharacterized repeat protein (TIGR01451 family)